MRSTLEIPLMRSRQGTCKLQKRHNNPVELGYLQVKSAMAVRSMFNNNQTDIKNIKIIQKGFSNHKEMVSNRSVSHNAKPSALNRKEGFNVHLTWIVYPNNHT
ncbi:hypothetical protein MS3_00001099 [Schistosoma haematobium]|uniref:Uncharacterized protein n=1 Tax=Schistosoma haematobium TaxID=6185 RepID=A0A922LMZ6_SCHHA|nr:hypothetical protein MS3_00001099 [Schistosoma haematobium]KAH9590111.1 hypothetical protein MS3_00001099 [Schistosoma haematobium]